MTDLTLLSAPRIPLDTFARVLTDAASPAAVEAAACYAAIAGELIDPAIGLAFFAHESTYGTRGVAVRTRNWGNLRRGQGRAVRVGDGWAWYATWADGAADWAALIRRVYVARGLTTVRAALPVYAPWSDHNRPTEYADAVIASVARWQAAAAASATPRAVVVAAAGARIRERPTRQSAIVRTLAVGQVVAVDHIIADGEPVPLDGGGASARWAAVTAPAAGFVWVELLRMEEPTR